MHIAFINYGMQQGGAERVIAHLANYLTAQGWKVTILTLDDADSTYALNSAVNHQRLVVAKPSPRIWTAAFNHLNRLIRIRRAVKRLNPDLVVSFQTHTNVLSLLATYRLDVPIVVSERVDPAFLPRRSWLFNLAQRITYRWAAAIVTQTQRATDWFPSRLQSKCVVIENPVTAPERSSGNRGHEAPLAASELSAAKVIVALGRLEPQKNHALLLRSFAEVARNADDRRLWIIGDGSLRDDLEQLATQLKVADRVRFWGSQPFPGDFLHQADLFVLSSRFEGFPNALCEAMACGVAVISTDCPSGPREIIQDGFDGVLIPSDDQTALTAAMSELLDDSQRSERLGQNAKLILERFGIETIMKKWQALAMRLTSKPRGHRLRPIESASIDHVVAVKRQPHYSAKSFGPSRTSV